MRSSALSVALCTLLLAACAKQTSLPPEEVLRRASIANSGLLSAHIVITARISSVSPEAGTVDATGIVEGNMQQGGNQLDIAFSTQGERTSDLQTFSWKATGHLIVLSSQESYITFENVETTPALPMLSLPEFQNFAGSWFRLPSIPGSSPELTPDPRLLRLQSDTVRVTKDHGVEMMDGKSMIHYDVAIDPELLKTYLQETSSSQNETTMQHTLEQLSQYDATGEIWIDAETYLLTKAVWNIAEKGKDGPVLTLSMSLSNPGLQVTVTAPEDAKPFPSSPLLPAGGATILQEY